MNRFSLFIALITPGIVSCLVMGDEPAVTSDSVTEVNQVLDRVQAEIDRRRQLVEFGEPIHAQYVRELIQEHNRVSNEMQLALQQDLPVAFDQLRNKQRRIVLKLWHLERLKPMLAEVDEKYYSLTSELRTLRRRHRDTLRDATVADRFTRISLSVGQIERERLARRMTSDRAFFDVSESLEARQAPADQDVDEPAPIHPMEQLKRPIQRLIKLTWRDGRIVVDRTHWQDMFPTESLASIAIEADKELKERGLRLSQNAHRSFLPEKVFFERESNVFLLFQNCRHAVSQLGHDALTSTTLRGKNGGVVSTKQVSVLVQLADNAFLMEVDEKTARKRQLRILDDGQSVSISYGTDDKTWLELGQVLDAEASVRFRMNGHAFDLQGDTLADVYAKDPELIEEHVFPELRRLGIIPPMTRFDPRIINLVVTKIRLTESQYSDELMALIEQADGPRFQLRTEAMRRLNEDMEVFAPLILEWQKSSEMSLELRRRLKRVTTLYEREFGQLETLVAKLNLMQRPDYLREILHRSAPEQQEMIRDFLGAVK
ncbi:MAG: hypothetical protein AAGG48_21350 [Planctomycetota bacterium]